MNLRRSALRSHHWLFQIKDLSSRVRYLEYVQFDLLGKILKDEKTLEESKVENGVTVNLVKAQTSSTGSTEDGKSAESNPFAAFEGMGMPPSGFAMPGMGMGMPDPNTIS